MSDLGDFKLGTTLYDYFVTTAAATGAPTTLSGSPVVSVYEDDSDTQITAGITLGVDADSRTGFNRLTIVATSGNGFEVGKQYSAVITTGTVGGTSAVGYVVSSFSIEKTGLNLTNTSVTAGAVPTLGLQDSGTLQSATATTAVLRSAAAFADDILNGSTLIITGGTGAGQSRIITDYTGASDTCTVDTWTTTPDNTSTYLVVGTAPAVLSGTLPLVNASAAQSATTSAATAQSSAESTTLSSVALRATSAAESATLSAVAVVPSAVMSTAASAGGIHADTKKINATTVQGAGTSGNKWRG